MGAPALLEKYAVVPYVGNLYTYNRGGKGEAVAPTTHDKWWCVTVANGECPWEATDTLLSGTSTSLENYLDERDRLVAAAEQQIVVSSAVTSCIRISRGERVLYLVCAQAWGKGCRTL